jgi:hypothetical protein
VIESRFDLSSTGGTTWAPWVAALVAWPVLLAAALELGAQGNATITLMALLLLVPPALGLVLALTARTEAPTAAALVLSPAIVQALAHPSHPRRPARLIVPDLCCHCGRAPVPPRRRPRIVRVVRSGRILAGWNARPATRRRRRSDPRWRRAPRIATGLVS